MLLLLAAMVFIGYSVGKPIVEFLGGREPAVNGEDLPADSPDLSDEQPKTEEVTKNAEPPAKTEPTVTETAPASQPEEVKPAAKAGGVFFISFPESGSYQEYVLDKIDYAKENGYSGICVELIADGGGVLFNTQNELAVAAQAVNPNGIGDLAAVVKAAQDAGLKPYARISALSDHIASWYDKSVSYMIEGSISRWLDNGINSGGKPWLSPFEQRSKDYIGGLCREISEAGFEGLIAKDMEFPKFRQRDLDYIGSKVKSADRYKALVDFSETVYNSFGTAKEFLIEADIEDIVSGSDELLCHSQELCTKTVYINFDPERIGLRIRRTNGDEISLEGLDNANILKVLLRHVGERLEGSGLTVLPVISGCEVDDSMIAVLEDMGFDPENVAVLEKEPAGSADFGQAL